jgi:hypothetical protein
LVLSQLPSHADTEFLKENRGVLVVMNPDFVKDFIFPKINGEVREEMELLRKKEYKTTKDIL